MNTLLKSFVTLSLLAGTVTSAQAACDHPTALKKVFALLQKFEDDKTLDSIHSNQSTRSSAEQNGKYPFLITYNSTGPAYPNGPTITLKKIAHATVDTQTCKIESYSGSSVVEVDENGTEL